MCSARAFTGLVGLCMYSTVCSRTQFNIARQMPDSQLSATPSSMLAFGVCWNVTLLPRSDFRVPVETVASEYGFKACYFCYVVWVS